jgi:uncharacterized protein
VRDQKSRAPPVFELKRANSLGTDLHAPLGQNKKNADSKKRNWAKLVRPVAYVAALFVIGGISTYSVVQPLNIHNARMPAPAASKTIAAGKQPGSATSGKGLPVSGSQDGANVVHQMMEDGSIVTTFSPKGRNGNGPLIVSAGQTQNPRLAGTANDDLQEDTPEGKLPIIGKNGLRPFDYYARPWSGARGTRIAIIVSGLGISQTGTMRAIQYLPEEVTLAFAANGNSLSRWVPEARQNGHEVLLQVPMEPFDYPDTNPGPGTLVTSKSVAANIANLHRDMARMNSYTGVMNYLGGKFLSNPDALEPVMQDIGSRGLMFVDDGSSAQSVSGKIAGALSMPHVFADVTLDSDVNEDAILKKLDELERIAQQRGSAIGVATGFDESIAAIRKWVDEVSGRGIEIVGVSALADTPGKN